MRPEADWTQAIAQTFRLPENADKWPLPVGGYLLAVSLRADSEQIRGTDLNWRAEYEITDCNGVALHERIRWEYPMSACGVAFADPLPNMNAAAPYVLSRVHPAVTPGLSVTLVHLSVSR